MTTEHVLILVLAAVATCAAVAVFYKGAALKVKIAKMLLTTSAATLQLRLHAPGQDRAVPGRRQPGRRMVKETEWLVRQLENPKTATTLFDGVFANELTTRLANSSQCAALMTQLSGWAAANPAAGEGRRRHDHGIAGLKKEVLGLGY